jgi:hypothetical protein
LYKNLIYNDTTLGQHPTKKISTKFHQVTSHIGQEVKNVSEAIFSFQSPLK